ncbi:MAG: allantoate amidohydrolase [Actinomycetota bacterium]|nr:allantoate amidohydrolase [Actinomycetota bacterium]
MGLAESFRLAWDALEPIGRDPATGGYSRFAWTSDDAALGAWFQAEAVARGMAAEQDRNGNQWAWWGDPGPGSVVTGSHLDSVPGGGAFDGPLGVLAGFLAVDDLRARGITPRRPLAVVRFVEEEGARFGVSCLGSRLLTGDLAGARAGLLRDSAGVSLAEAMRAAGADPTRLGHDPEFLSRIATFVELHVEQGRALADIPDAVVGLATGIWPHGRWHYAVTGEPNHAGTTRLDDRHDPMLGLAALVIAARSAARRADGVATVGKVRVDPGAANGIAATAGAWLDARGPDEAAIAAIVEEVTAATQAAAGEHGLTVDVNRVSYSPAVDFDRALTDRLAALLRRDFGPVPLLASGAGHDAGILAATVPTAMLFVRNPTGHSHTPAESATAGDCVAGAQALAAVVAELAC